MNRLDFENTLKADGYDTITPIERPADYSLGEHTHPFDACALVTAGEIMLTVAGVSRTYAAGDIFRLAAGTVHLESAGPAGVSYLSGRKEAVAP